MTSAKYFVDVMPQMPTFHECLRKNTCENVKNDLHTVS